MQHAVCQLLSECPGFLLRAQANAAERVLKLAVLRFGMFGHRLQYMIKYKNENVKKKVLERLSAFGLDLRPDV